MPPKKPATGRKRFFKFLLGVALLAFGVGYIAGEMFKEEEPSPSSPATPVTNVTTFPTTTLEGLNTKKLDPALVVESPKIPDKVEKPSFTYSKSLRKKKETPKTIKEDGWKRQGSATTEESDEQSGGLDAVVAEADDNKPKKRKDTAPTPVVRPGGIPEKKTVAIKKRFSAPKKKVLAKQNSPSRQTGTHPVHEQKVRPGYTVQVGAFAKMSDAESLAKKLSKRGYPTYVTRFHKNGATWSRVRVGPFKSAAAAKKIARRLSEKEALSTFISREK